MLRRRFLLALKIVALVAIVYEAVVNAFLATGGLARLLSGDPDKLLVQYAWGWSVWPGYLHARRLRVRSRDSSVEFDLRIERCGFRVVLSELPRRLFHVTRVSGSGITFDARTRIPPSEATPERLDALPRIDGLEAVPLEGPKSPPPDDAHYHLLTFALDAVDAEDVREIWMNTLRFDGSAHVVGGFFLRPVRWAAIGPVTAYFASGRLTTGDDVVGTDVRGRLETTIDGFDPRVTHGVDVFRRTSAHVQLDGAVPSLAFLRRLIPNVAIHGGAGRARVDVLIDHGNVTPPTAFDWNAQRLAAETSTVSVHGDFRVAVRSDVGARDALRFDVAGADVGATIGREGPDRAQLRDASIAFGAEFEPAAQVATGELAIEVGHTVLDLGSQAFEGAARSRIAFRRWSFRSLRGDVSGSRIEVLDVSDSSGTKSWWADLSLPAGELSLAAPALSARVVLRARDTRLLARSLVSVKVLPEWTAPLATAHDLEATAEVRIGGAARSVDVRDLHASAGAFRVEGGGAKSRDALHVVGLIGLGPLRAGVESVDGNVHLQVVDVDDWYRAHAFASSAP